MDKDSRLSANKLLERAPEKSYIDEWTTLLMQERNRESSVNESSVVIFRLSKEWLALSTLFFSSVAEGQKVHSIPQRNPLLLLGVVNLRGQLRLCVNLHYLLQVDDSNPEVRKKDLSAHHRMLAIQKNGEEWVFPVDEINGISQLDLSTLQNVPVTVAKSTANFLKGVITWKDKRIGLLDEELLFTSLRRSID